VFTWLAQAVVLVKAEILFAGQSRRQISSRDLSVGGPRDDAGDEAADEGQWRAEASVRLSVAEPAEWPDLGAAEAAMARRR
jgi:hypothetical protein